MLSKDVHPKILKSLSANKNPIKDNCESISKLIYLQQKFLSLSAAKYGIYDIKTIKLANNYLCSLVFRIYTVSKLFKNLNVDGIVLKQMKYYDWVKYLSYSNVFSRRADLIKKVFIPKYKRSECLLSISTITDKLIQKLFVITYEPIIETVSDIYSFGFRKNWNAHQALGILFSKLYGLRKKNKSFNCSKYILNYDIQKLFDSVRQDWLIWMFPAHNKHKFQIKTWLRAGISFKRVVLLNYESFSQRNIIGPLLLNFMLNGLGNIIRPEKVVFKNKIKWKWLIEKGLSKEKANKKSRILVWNIIVRYVDDFIIITNCENEVPKIIHKVHRFLLERNLKTNISKKKIFEFDKGQPFDFLGFTFKFMIRSRISRITRRVNEQKQVIKPRIGLFVYVSNDFIKRFKSRINNELRFLNKRPFQIILRLNVIIKSWANYYGIGSYETFKKIDWYIFKRCFRFIYKKFCRTSKYNIVANFFLHKIGNVNWNFNAFVAELNKNTCLTHIVLIRICSMIKFIYVLKLRPYSAELKNPFVSFEIKEQWFNRISRLRYKLGCSFIMTSLFTK